MPRTEHPTETCVRVSELPAGDRLRILTWRCNHDGPRLRLPRSFDWPVLGLGFGGASVVHSGRETHQVDPSRAIWHPAGQPYWTTHPFGFGDHGCSLMIHPEVVEEIVLESGADRKRWIPLRALPLPPRSARAVRQAVFLSRCHKDGLAAQETLIGALGDILRIAAGGTAGLSYRRFATGRHRRRVVARAQAFLYESFRENHTLERIGRAAGASAFHLSRIFRAETGLSIHRYRARLRLAAALDAIGDGVADLAELALELGFSSHSHLTAAFRQQIGVTPSEWRRGLLLDTGPSNS